MGKYDRIIQENIQPLTLTLIRKILNIGDAELTILPRKMQRTLEREADLVIKVSFADNRIFIYNIEWQTSNDPDMHKRMMLQHALLFQMYNLPVLGFVIYTGVRSVSMQTEIRHDNFFFQYELADLSSFRAEEFINSDSPDEVVVSILAGRPSREQARLQVREILIKLHALLGNDVTELNRRIVQLEVLSELRGFQDIIIEEEKNMPIILDDSKSIRFQQGLKRGLEKGFKKATDERNVAFVLSLLLHTGHSLEEIATLVGVPIEFVLQVKAAHSKS